MDMERYTKGRNEIIKKHRRKILSTMLPILGGAIAIALAAVLIFGREAAGYPYMGVILVGDLLVTVIYLTMRLAILSHRKQKELLLFEEEQLTSPFNKF